jgi:hypothetical protein
LIVGQAEAVIVLRIDVLSLAWPGRGPFPTEVGAALGVAGRIIDRTLVTLAAFGLRQPPAVEGLGQGWVNVLVLVEWRLPSGLSLAGLDLANLAGRGMPGKGSSTGRYSIGSRRG